MKIQYQFGSLLLEAEINPAANIKLWRRKSDGDMRGPNFGAAEVTNHQHFQMRHLQVNIII